MANAAPLTTILAQGKGEPDFLDGLLDITWINTESGSGIKGLLELSIAGMLSVNPGPSVKHVQAQHVQITVEPPRNYVIDGEVYPSEDLDISISPESLAVYC